jgi:ParB/RepB/Spo0J family partition protein
MELSISKITVSDMNPRKSFDESELAELQASVEQYGILEPLIVRKVGSQYQLVAGERRFRAAKAAGFKEVPVVVKALTDTEVHEIMLIENLQRSSLAPLEEAQSLQVILDQGEHNQTELAAKLGKSQSWVANRLRLLSAPDELKDMLISRQISTKHVIAALPYSPYPVFQKIVDELREKFSDDNSCSVSEFNVIINDVVTKLYDNDYTFDLDRPPHQYYNCRQYLDFSKCDGCKHVVLMDYYGDTKHRHCLERECWKHLVSMANDAYMNEREKVIENLTNASVIVDSSKLDYDQYTRIYDSQIDIASCNSCDNRRKDADNCLICLDPACYKKKQKAHTRERNKSIKLQSQLVWNAVDAWIGSFNDLDPRWVLTSLIYTFNEGRVIKALSRWGKLAGTNAYLHTDEVVKFVSSIPDQQVLEAIARVICADRLGQYDNLSMEILEKFVPAAVPFYVSPEASE